MDLIRQKCVPCEVGGLPMEEHEARKHLAEISGWTLGAEAKRIERVFSFGDFKKAMAFVNQVADVAETEGHHPDIAISYNRVTIMLRTHAVGGLTLNDLILAAKINEIVGTKDGPM